MPFDCNGSSLDARARLVIRDSLARTNSGYGRGGDAQARKIGSKRRAAYIGYKSQKLTCCKPLKACVLRRKPRINSDFDASNTL
jgi:hypothetical protein